MQEPTAAGQSENIAETPLGKELVIALPNTCTLRCGEGTEQQWGGYVRVCDPAGEELLYWDVQEWAEQPENIMGVIFSAATSSLETLCELRGDLDA